MVRNHFLVDELCQESQTRHWGSSLPWKVNRQCYCWGINWNVSSFYWVGFFLFFSLFTLLLIFPPQNVFLMDLLPYQSCSLSQGVSVFQKTLQWKDIKSCIGKCILHYQLQNRCFPPFNFFVPVHSGIILMGLYEGSFCDWNNGLLSSFLCDLPEYLSYLYCLCNICSLIFHFILVCLFYLRIQIHTKICC